MVVSVECSGCGGKFRAPDALAGKRVKCPKCSALIEVSRADEQHTAQKVAPVDKPSHSPPALPAISASVRHKSEGRSRGVLWAWIGGAGATLVIVLGLLWVFGSRERGGPTSEAEVSPPPASASPTSGSGTAPAGPPVSRVDARDISANKEDLESGGEVPPPAAPASLTSGSATVAVGPPVSARTDEEKPEQERGGQEQRNLRIWTFTTGEPKTEARLVGFDAGKVRLKKKDASLISVRIENLSQPDQEFVTKRMPPGADIYDAASCGNLSRVEALLAAGASVSTKDDQGSCALHIACEKGTLPIVEVLLEAGADVNANDSFNRTPLSCAAAEGHSDVVELLLSYKPELETKNARGATALMVAAYRGHKGCAALLIDAGANVDAAGGPQGITALHIAALSGHDEVISLLLAKGAKIDARRVDQSTALHCALANEHVPEGTSLLLISKGADVNAVNSEGLTPLHFAAAHGKVRVIEALARKKAKLEVRDHHLSTPLHYAVRGYEKNFGWSQPQPEAADALRRLGAKE